METNLENTIAVLERTPAALDALLRGLPEMWTRRNEGENTWCAAEVVGHLIHGERRDWIPRTKRLLEFGESKPFERFDRQGHLRYSREKTLDQLLDEFARLRAESLTELRVMDLRAEDLERLGTHPALGTVTLGQLLSTWAAHDVNHLHQIARVMAHQYREAVGPWTRFMGVMHCGGHGEAA
ncbi:MAG: DinB family protein [Terracidiphilus sp.]